MAVSDIEIRNLGKFLGNAPDHSGIVDHPEVMAEAVGSGEIIFRLACGHCVDYFLQRLIVGESEENRLDVCVVDADMLHTVLLLVAAGKLVLLDAALHVVGDICRPERAIRWHGKR